MDFQQDSVERIGDFRKVRTGGRVDALVVTKALKLVEVIHGDREGADLNYLRMGR